VKTAFIFPGQGSQTIGMGKDFYTNSSKAREILDEASDALGHDLKTVMFEPNELLEKTAYTQPAIFTLSAMATALFKDATDLKPQFALGHSLGEFSALHASGALPLSEGVRLVHQRGRLMQLACEGVDAGMMAVLGLDDTDVEFLCSRAREAGAKVWPANYNSTGQIVLAGIKSDLQALEPELKAAGAKRALVLNMSVASHCALLEDIKEPLIKELKNALVNSFEFPVISNVSAKSYQSKEEALSLLADQLTNPVRYKQAIENFDLHVDAYIELGGGVLKGLNRRISAHPTHAITDMTTLEEALKAIL
jgi:[acyl-carrier-protein] S-malonyltransferase